MLNFKNQKILVPFDFSAPSKEAVKQVLNWADETNIIHLFHVVHPTPVLISFDPPGYLPPGSDEKEVSYYVGEMEKMFGAKGDNLQFEGVIGDPGSEIVKAAKAKDVDIIVMPSHGRTGIFRLFLGSVAERVLRLADRPVLILRGEKTQSESNESKSEVAIG